ncbi:MAG: family 16 glycosylhydrolase [Thioploca sp.]|nr:family 16 glycosylhydrolase [Thioploca sp.]
MAKFTLIFACRRYSMKSLSIVILLLSLLPSLSQSSPICIFDDFENDNSVCWEPADNWGNGPPFWNGWRADHIKFNSGIMRLRLDDQPCVTDLATCSNQPYASGEYRSRELYRYGRFETRLKAAKQSGVVTAFFIYNDNPHDEIDIEILGLDPTQMQVNYFTHGVGGHEKMIPLGFDAAAAFHTYAIEWLPNVIRWYVDDQLVHTEIDSQGNLPTTPGKVMMNFWPVTVDVEQWAGRFTYSLPIDAQYEWFKYLPSYGVEFTLTTNKVTLSQGDTLSLSGTMMPTNIGRVQKDIYVTVALPGDKGVFSLDSNFTWKPGWVPILQQVFLLASIEFPNFYSLLLPTGLPLGKYTFSLIAVPVGADPLNNTTWLGFTSTQVFLTPPLTVFGAFPQFSKARAQPYLNKAPDASLSGDECKDPACLRQNSYALKLDYTMPSGTWGSDNLDLSHFDVSKATYLTLWTKGAVGGERLGIVLWSDCVAGFPGRPDSALISVEPNWRQHQILLADFQSYVDLSSLCRLSIDFNDAIHPQGTIYLDGIAFTDAHGKLIYTPDEVSLATYNSILAMIEPTTGLPMIDLVPYYLISCHNLPLYESYHKQRRLREQGWKKFIAPSQSAATVANMDSNLSMLCQQVLGVLTTSNQHVLMSSKPNT